TQVFKGRANYEPNSLSDAGEDGGPRECPVAGFKTFIGRSDNEEQGDKLRLRPESFADHYSQARMFFESQTENEKAHIASALVFELSKVTLEHIPPRLVANLRNVSDELAKRVAAGLGIPLPKKASSAQPTQDFPRSDALSIQKNMKPILEGRTIGILIADGTDAANLTKLRKLIEKAGAKAKIVAPKITGIGLSDGTMVKVDGQLAGAPSPIFDAVAVLLSADSAKMLAKDAVAIQWVMDAFGHLKAIGHNAESQPLLSKAYVEKDEGITGTDAKFIQAASQRFWKREASVRKLA
ncbi:MAG: catalase HPII, partial [Pseudomonadota bacterium]|nr:catalase HPII [Pseudomonadota bacterium]